MEFDISTNLKGIACVLEAVAWPIVVAVTLFVSRNSLGKFIAEIGKRITKLSIGDYEVELSVMPEIAANSVSNFDVMELLPSRVFDSGASELFRQLAVPDKADYAIIDLGDGKKWLSSRLYIFALILGEVSNLKTFVFLENRNNFARCFVGSATPSEVCKNLEKRYPWLGYAINKARTENYTSATNFNDSFGLADIAGINSMQITNLIRRYIELIQQSNDPDVSVHNEWEMLDKQTSLWERANWLKGMQIQEMFASDLCTSTLIDLPEYHSNAALKVKEIFKRSGECVAVIDEKERFKHLINRVLLLENLSKTV
jgi:hypothetical protein